MRPLRVIAAAVVAGGRLLLVSKRGAPAPAAEIAGLEWWPGPRRLALAPAVSEHVIPALRGAGRL